MGRLEFLPCVYRDKEGRLREVEYPKDEPDPYDVVGDLYCPSYAVRKGVFGPARLEDFDVTIFNTRTYRRDSDLEEVAKDRLVQAIIAKEAPDIVSRAGGPDGIRKRVEIDTFWVEPGSR